MFPRRTNNWLRVGAGFGLVFLLAAQQKLWPWLGGPPNRTAAPRRLPAESDSDWGARKRAAKQLPYILPDTPAPRWPAAWHDASLRQTAGWRDGAVARGEREPSSGTSPVGAMSGSDPLAWHRFLDPSGPGDGIQPTPCRVVFPFTILAASISPTGPPRR
jgi:hypothetical protein